MLHLLLTRRALQHTTSCITEATQLFGLEIQSAPQEEYCPPNIIIKMNDLKVVHQVTYLRCNITSDIRINKEVEKLAKMSSEFCRLYKCMWYNKYQKSTKSSACTEPVSLPPSYMAQSHGSLTSTTYNSLNSSTNTTSTPTLTSTGVISSPILKSLKSNSKTA